MLQLTLKKLGVKLEASQVFMLSVLLVNAGNYLYNLILGRWLGPEVFAGAALLITLLLVLSFLAMTMQLLCAKFVIVFSGEQLLKFRQKVYVAAIVIGSIFGILCISFAKNLQQLFVLDNHYVFILFGIGIPIYFIMSVSRGLHQGKQEFIKLSQSYLTEMFGRLVTTFLLLTLVWLNPLIAVSVGIFVSFIVGLFPNQFKWNMLKKTPALAKNDQKLIWSFVLITCLYECTQIVINNSDILVVKHYFEAEQAGLYAALALIGRVVYFLTWMLVMILLPKVIVAQKNGENTSNILKKYLSYILVLTSVLVVGCYFFPETIITLLFGKAYISMSALLWKYALATSLFALSNVFVYYFLSLERYLPVALAMIFGLLQVGMLVVFHESLHQVVLVQIALMCILLAVQVVFWLTAKNEPIKTEEEGV